MTNTKRNKYGAQLCVRKVKGYELIDIFLYLPHKKGVAMVFQTDFANYHEVGYKRKYIYCDLREVNRKRLIKGYNSQKYAIKSRMIEKHKREKEVDL